MANKKVLYWNVPLARLALWLGVCPSTILNWGTGLAVTLFSRIQLWLLLKTTGRCLAVDEKWLKIKKTWQYWFVGLDEATGLPRVMVLLPTRTNAACFWFLLQMKRFVRTALRRRARLATTDGAQTCGLADGIGQTTQKFERLKPACRDNALPRTTKSLERCSH